jgi:localization factor PodJL
MMKFGRPWNVEGVRPRAQETARTAARRSRVTVGEWLDSAIIERAAGESVDVPGAHDDGDRPRGDLATINDRLTHLTKQLDRIERTGSGAQLDERLQDRDAIANLDQRIGHVITEGRFAVREIERRAMSIDQALSNLGRARLHGAYLAPPSRPPIEPGAVGDVTKPRATDTACAPSELQRGNLDLSGLEQQLVRISRQIETMARPCHAEAVSEALRIGLADIKGMITARMPARAVEAIENEIRTLVRRLDAGRDRGPDQAAFGALERNLAEVRDELRRHAPVNLAGFDDAVQTLSRKFDIIAASLPDPGALQRIDDAVAAVGSVVSQLASNEAIASVAQDVRMIAEKLELMAATAVQSPSVQAGPAASARLENKITQLAKKVDASEARLTRLGSIERGLSELVQHLERIRARNAQAAAPTQLVISGEDDPVSGSKDDAVEALRRRVDALINKRAAEQRTESGPESVQGTVGGVAGGDATTESDGRQFAPPFVASEETPFNPPTTMSLHEQPRQPKAMQSAIWDYASDNDVKERAADQPLSAEADFPSAEPDSAKADGAELQTKSTPKAALSIGASSLMASPRTLTARVTRLGPAFTKEARSARPMPLAATRLPIDPTLPPDTPLEPGSGKQHTGTVGVGVIAATSEGTSADDLDKMKSRAEFIAAARRAAQVAASEREDVSRVSDETPINSEKTLTQRMKTLLFVGVLLVTVLGLSRLGFYHFYQPQAGNGFNHGGSVQPITTPSQLNAAPARVHTIVVAPGPRAVAESSPPSINSSRVPAPEPSVTTATTSQDLSDRQSAADPPHGSSVVSQSNGTGGLTGATTPSLAPDNVQAASLSPATAAVSAPEGEGRSAINTASRLYADLSAGNPAAAYEMGSRFAEGRGVSVNFQQAALWFDRAAKAGSIPGLFRLAVLYERGQGVAKDPQEARRLYLAAADKGHTKAMHNLAVMYVQAIDGKPDFATAARWFQKAANYGVVDSQYNLGVLLWRGVGVDQNLSEAYKWFALAAGRGDREAANRRNDVAALLDAQSLNAARLAVQAFVAETPPADVMTNPEPPGGWDQVPSGASSPPPRVTAPQPRVIL